jgi:hypothetical protein
MWGHLRGEVAWRLGDAFLAGAWNESELKQRGLAVLDVEKEPRWLMPLVRRALAAHRDPPVDRRAELHRWLHDYLGNTELHWRPPKLAGVLFPMAGMGRMRWPVPELPTLADLAAHLDLHLHELEWLADPRGWEAKAADEPLRNYRYRWLPRAGATPRLIEAPKRHLRDLQRRVLHDILTFIPPHPDSHGFRRGHSPVTNARRHTGSRVVIGFDLEDFFACITPARIYGIFRGAGYPETVAHRLTALSTNVVPTSIWNALVEPDDPRDRDRHYRLGRRLASPHLPQGAPTSPALANLAAFGLDRRLSALATRSGATYSRYADDLTFSGSNRLLTGATAFRQLVAEIVDDEGLRLNPRKSRLASHAGRQVVTGVVVNAHPNLARRDYDRLRATLHEATQHGPDQANRNGVPDFRSHLLGRIAWAEQLNPARGTKLRTAFAAINW